MIINPTQSPKSQKRGMDQNIDNLSFPTFSQKIIGSHTHTQLCCQVADFSPGIHCCQDWQA